MTDTVSIKPFGSGPALHVNGIPVYSTPYLEPQYFAVDLPAYSRNRSQRVFKKLMLRVRLRAKPVWTDVFMITDPFSKQRYVACHPTVYHQLRQQVST